jgi:hypothetical protein
MDGVQISYLHEPGAHTFHDLLSGTETSAPVSLPLQEVARVQGVRTELKDSTKLARSSCGPEGELLHQRCLFRVDQGLELAIKLREVRVVLNGVQRCVITFVALVLPDVNCEFSISKEPKDDSGSDEHTKGIAVSDLCSPTSDQMNLILRHVGHTRVPGADKLNILVDLVGLDIVQDDAVNVFAAGKDLTEAALDLLVHLTALVGTVEQVGKTAALLAIFLLTGYF